MGLETAENSTAPAITGDLRAMLIEMRAKESEWESRVSSSQHGRPERAADFRMMSVRYLGGLPMHPAQVNVTPVITSDGLFIQSASGTMATIPLASILSAVAFDAETSVGWFGLSFGNAITLSNPVINTGGWFVTFGQDGSIYQFALGAKGGWFGQDPTALYFRGVNMTLGGFGLAPSAAEDRELEVGPVTYARELGFAVDDVAEFGESGSGQSSPAGSDPTLDAARLTPTERLAEAKSMLDAGLISEAAYEAIKAKIIDSIA